MNAPSFLFFCAIFFRCALAHVIGLVRLLLLLVLVCVCIAAFVHVFHLHVLHFCASLFEALFAIFRNMHTISTGMRLILNFRSM